MVGSDAEKKLYDSLIQVPGAMVNSSIQPLRIKDEDFLNKASYIMQKKTGDQRFKYNTIDEIPLEILEAVVDRLKDYVELDIKIIDRVTNQRARDLALKKYPTSFMTMEDFKKEYPDAYNAWKELY
jgi:hypothetical protein